MSSESLYLGIDGGGTKCKARLELADGQLIGSGRSGSANPVQSFSGACESIIDSALQAIKSAGLKPSSISNIVAGLGLAGVTLPEYKKIMTAWEHPFAKTIVTSDLHTACIGAHNGGDGAVIITGTGSNAGAVIQGECREFSGYGFTLADKGSGAKLGLAALSATLEYLDGLSSDSLLVQAVLEKTQCSRATEIAELTLDWSPRHYGEYASLVFDLAKQGDEAAVELVNCAASHVDRIARHLFTLQPPRFSMVGGIAEPLRQWLADDVLARLEPPLNPPEVGAIILARQGMKV